MNTNLVEEAQKVIPLPQVLINVVSKRVRQLSMGQRPLIDVSGLARLPLADIALNEIIQGKISVEEVAVEVP